MSSVWKKTPEIADHVHDERPPIGDRTYYSGRLRMRTRSFPLAEIHPTSDQIKSPTRLSETENLSPKSRNDVTRRKTAKRSPRIAG